MRLPVFGAGLVPGGAASLRFFLGGCLILALAACAPRYNWREVQSAGFTATFPGKTSSASRRVSLDGLPVDMTMQAARVDDVTFAVGWADLQQAADASPANPAVVSALMAMRNALLTNIAGQQKSLGTVRIPRRERALDAIAAEEMVAEGKSGGKAVRLVARFAAHPVPGAAKPAPGKAAGARLIQIVVLGPAADLDSAEGRDAIETFMASVRLN